MISLLEAGIDFAEDDISVAPARRNPAPSSALIQHGASVAACNVRRGQTGVSRDSRWPLPGGPNVGKSSLFNRLLEQDRAIVTDIPGTTRDLVSETTSLEGIPVKLVDTAGIREAQDLVETLGIERSYQAMADADLTLLVLDASTDLTRGRSCAARKAADRRPLLVGNKADLGQHRCLDASGLLPVSALTGEGIAELRSAS